MKAAGQQHGGYCRQCRSHQWGKRAVGQQRRGAGKHRRCNRPHHQADTRKVRRTRPELLGAVADPFGQFAGDGNPGEKLNRKQVVPHELRQKAHTPSFPLTPADSKLAI